MTWFAASLIKSVFIKNEDQEEFPVFETIFIIEAISFDEAEAKANNIGQMEEMADANLTYCGKQAYSKCMGIRKLKATHNLDHDLEIGSSRPSDGTEIISSYFEISDRQTLRDFIDGKSVMIKYVDDDIN